MVRKSQAQADTSTRVDTTTTTTTPSRGAIISANAVGVFYRGIFLRADPVYTAEWYTAPTFNAIRADSDATTLRTLQPAVVHNDVRQDARQLGDTIHRLAARMTPGSCIINEATTHEYEYAGTVRPPADFTHFSLETLSARNTEEEPQREPQQRSSAVDPPPAGWQWVRRRAAREKSTDREGAVTEPAQPKLASRNRRGSSVWASTRPAAAPAAHEDSPSTALNSCGHLNDSSPSTTCEDSVAPCEDSPSKLWNIVYSY